MADPVTSSTSATGPDLAKEGQAALLASKQSILSSLGGLTSAAPIVSLQSTLTDKGVFLSLSAAALKSLGSPVVDVSLLAGSSAQAKGVGTAWNSKPSTMTLPSLSEPGIYTTYGLLPPSSDSGTQLDQTV